MNKKTLPPPPDFDSPEEAKDIIHFLWNKLAESVVSAAAGHYILCMTRSGDNPSPPDRSKATASFFCEQNRCCVELIISIP
ncbi:hypothetical protein FG475_15165 [Vibrio navarrensis]|nr:hypothetical protein [Vibrio navarrensis]HDY8121367.1 hypothetical protein [Vibrio vulnificus]